MVCFSLSSSFVSYVKDLLFSNETTIGDLKLGLVEWFWLVEVVSVGSAVHVSVQVLLSFPGGAVPELTIALVAAGHGVRASVHYQFRRVFEYLGAVATSPVGLVVDLRVVETRTGRCLMIIFGLVVASGVEHRASSVTATSRLHSLIVLWNQFGVETAKKKEATKN